MPSRPKAFRPGCPIRGPSNLGSSCPKATVPRPDRPKTSRPWKVHPKASPSWTSDAETPLLHEPSGPRAFRFRARRPKTSPPWTSPPEDVPVSAPVPKGPLATARSPKGSPAWSVVPEGHPLRNPSTRRLPDPAQLPTRRPETEQSYVATNRLRGLRRKQQARPQNALSWGWNCG